MIVRLRPSSIVLPALLAFAGCTSSNEPITRDSGLSDDGGAPDASLYDEPQGCIELPNDSVAFQLEAFRNDGFDACGSVDGPDVAFTWRAPARGRYVVTSRGGTGYLESEPLVLGGQASSELNLPPQLAALRGACGEELLSCAGHVSLEDGSLQRLVVALEADEAVTLIAQLESDRLAESDPHHAATLSIEPAACAELDLGSEAELHHETGLYGTHSPVGPVSCGDEPSAPTEVSWRYRAPAAGRYAFELSEEYGEPVRLARFSADCFEELACEASVADGAARLELDLEADEDVILVGSAHSSGDTDYQVSLDITALD